ncbi:MAG: acyl-CoA dehydrogenase, partial [Bacillota bacterium]
MMYLTDDQRAVQEMARAFAEREVAPLAAEYERRRCLPPGIVRRMGEQGLIGVMFPEEYGGAGGDVLAQALAVQEISKVNAGIGATLLVQVLALYPIWKVGSEELKRKYLPRGIRGEIIGAIGMTEPDAGSDFAAIRTRAGLDGGHFGVNGRKRFITNGPR